MNATYICVWDLDFGSIDTDFDVFSLDGFLNAVKTFAHTFSDKVNSLPADLKPAIDPDVTFLTARVPLLSGILRSSSTTAFQVKLSEGILFDFHDLPDAQWSKFAALKIPRIDMRTLNLAEGEAHNPTWLETALLQSGLLVQMRSRPSDWRHRRSEKIAFLATHDMLSRRLAPLLTDVCEFPQHNSGHEIGASGTKQGIFLPSLEPVALSNQSNRSVSDSASFISSSASASTISHEMHVNLCGFAVHRRLHSCAHLSHRSSPHEDSPSDSDEPYSCE